MKHIKKLFALVLAVLLIAGLIPVNSVLADVEMPVEAEEELQINSFNDDADEWEIDLDEIIINNYDIYDDFSEIDYTVKAGDEVKVWALVNHNGYEADYLVWESYIDPDDGEEYYHATGYKEGYDIRYSMVPETDGAPEIEVTDNLNGSGTFIAEGGGTYILRMEFSYQENVICSWQTELTIKKRAPLPANYTVTFEQEVSYYGEFERIPVDTYYTDKDNYYISAYPVLYIEGRKVLNEEESTDEYFKYKWINSSNEDVISIEDYGYWADPVFHQEGTTDLTAAIYYAANKEEDPQLLTEAVITVVVSEYEITTKDSFDYNNNTMYIIGETAVIQPVVYKDYWRIKLGAGGEWVYEYEDLSAITFDYQIQGLSADQYEISEDTHTLTIPDIKEGQYIVSVSAKRGEAFLTKTYFYVCGAPVPQTLGLTIRSFDNLEDGIYAHRTAMPGLVVAEGVGFEWGRVRFEFLDPKTEQPLWWISDYPMSGSYHPDSVVTASSTGDVLIRASLYREIGDTENPLVTEEKILHVYSPVNSGRITLAKDKTFTVKASDVFKNAGLTIDSIESTDTSVFTISNGKITAKGSGSASLKIMVKGEIFAYIPVNVYDVTLSYSSKAYTGSALKPSVKSIVGPFYMEYDGADLNHTFSSSDWSVKYSNNINAGTATATITLQTGNGAVDTIKQTFKITQASIAKATVTVKDQTYTGKALQPAPVVKLGSKTLKKGTDYTVKYSNNKNVGKATVTITGTGNYKGTVKQTFKINPKGTTIKSLTAGSKQITVKWTKQATQTTGYQIQCSLTKDFKKIAGKTVTVSGATKTSGVISGLTKGKTYYVRIRTYKKISGVSYYSGWKTYSKTVKVK